MTFIDDELDTGRIDRIGAITADHGDVIDALLLERIDEPAQQRLAGDRQHDFRTVFGDGFEPLAAACREHDGRTGQGGRFGEVGCAVVDVPVGRKRRGLAGPQQRPHRVAALPQLGHEVPAQKAVGTGHEDGFGH